MKNSFGFLEGRQVSEMRCQVHMGTGDNVLVLSMEPG